MFKKLTKHVPSFLKSKWVIGALVLIVLALGYWFLNNSRKSPYQFVTVTRGAITETVSVTGNTTPVHSVSLGFGAGGTVARANASVGDHVAVGTVLATLNMNDLSAQLKEAEANVDVAKAKLAGLVAGARPEDIADPMPRADAFLSVMRLTYGKGGFLYSPLLRRRVSIALYKMVWAPCSRSVPSSTIFRRP
ncbi:biotin/lipoyl-binding protein [Candidatus Kaiserbacteria bacterium]|nr:biotin/lipoyl-binding protein [Candidatus Kaiserbacteria bacterium]